MVVNQLNKSSLNNHTLHPYLKQEITQKNLFYLHLMKEVGAGNSTVLLQSLHTPFYHIYTKNHHQLYIFH